MRHESSVIRTAGVVFLLLLIAVGCVERKPEMLTKKESPVTSDLVAMLKERDLMASDSRTSREVLAAYDLRHRQQVYQYLAQSLLIEPVDLYRAALVLQNADTATSKENFMLAYYLAMEAAKKGHEEAKFLSAASLDKYLVASGLRQKYGTQIGRDHFGRYYVSPFDTSTTDADRAVWDVPGLDSLVKLAEAKNR